MGGVSDVYFCLATHRQLLPQLRSTGARLTPLVLATGGQRSLGVSKSGRACVAQLEVAGQPLPSFMLGSPDSAAVPPRGLTFRGDPSTTKFSPRLKGERGWLRRWDGGGGVRAQYCLGAAIRSGV